MPTKPKTTDLHPTALPEYFLNPKNGVPIPQLPGYVVVSIAAIPVKMVEVDYDHNPRSQATYGALKEFGRALESQGVNQPITCVPSGKKRQPISVRDGYRRMTTINKGHAPSITHLKADLVMREDGSVPAEETIQYYCMSTNVARLALSPIDKGRFVRASVDDAFHAAQMDKDRVSKEKGDEASPLTETEKGQVRNRVIKMLAQVFGESEKNVKLSLDAVLLPKKIRDRVASGKMPMMTAREFLKIPADRVDDVLARMDMIYQQAKDTAKAADPDADEMEVPEGTVVTVTKPPRGGSSSSGKGGGGSNGKPSGKRSAPKSIPTPKITPHKALLQAKKEFGLDDGQKRTCRGVKDILSKISEVECFTGTNPVTFTQEQLAERDGLILRWVLQIGEYPMDELKQIGGGDSDSDSDSDDSDSDIDT